MARPSAVPLHFASPRDALFGWYHAAEGTRGCGVVLCHPINDDCVRAHRALRHLAERLVDAGFPVLRFDFHGTGDSSRDERAPDSVKTWIDDVGRAVAELRARSGVEKIALVGMRLGATIAAEAAARAGGVDTLVTWGAFETGAAFVAETTRMHKMHRMLEPGSFAAGPKSYAEGEEALGFFLTKETIASLGQINLRALPSRPAARVLVVDVGNTPIAVPFVEHLKSLDTEVTHRHLPGHKFLMSAPHKAVVPDEILDAIVSWLGDRHPAGNGQATRAGSSAVSAGIVTSAHGDPSSSALEELPLFYGARKSFGVLTKPPEDRRRTGRPAVILLNAGTAHRIGPHRSSVRMARAWAERGFHVFRIDLSGIGDSPAPATAEENVSYPSVGLDDCREAMSTLARETGASRFVFAGLCSGADTAFQIGRMDDRVTGVVMMNPQTFYVHDLSNIQAYKDGRYYQDSFFRKESWMKLARGDVDVKRVARMLAPKVKLEAMSRVKRLMGRASAGGDNEPSAELPDVPGWIRTMGDRGVETLLVATVHDAGVEFADAYYGKKMRALVDSPRFRRVDIEGTDNTFTSVYAQDFVLRAIADHLVARHLT